MKRIEVDGGYLDWSAMPNRVVQIVDIAAVSARRTGIGTALLKKLKSEIPAGTATVFAITRLSNTIAHQFYEARGFRLAGRLHYFYKEAGDMDEHALVYVLDL